MTSEKNKAAGHRGRLKDKFLTHGITGFTDTDIIEMLLHFGTPRKDCKEQAKALINNFGNLSAVLDAPVHKLTRVKGVGEKNIVALRFIKEVAARYLQQRLVGKQYFTSSSDVKEYLKFTMKGLKKEVLLVIFLDSSHAIIESNILCKGTVNYNTVYPREIIIQALEKNATALILAHNHPSGEIKPSIQDIKLTENLFLACKFLQINILDHMIIGREVYSFADEGLMFSIKEKVSKIVLSQK